MADNLNEQELQKLFRKHLPMKQMPPEFADQLKKQVLAEVAATLSAKPVASVVSEETAATPVMPVQERVAQRKAPRSVPVRSTVSWLDWFRDYFRLTPSMAMAGAMLLVLVVFIVWGSGAIPGLSGPFSKPTIGTGSIVELTAQALPAEETATTPTAVAVADVPSPSSTLRSTIEETATPEPPSTATEENTTVETVVVTANPAGTVPTPEGTTIPTLPSREAGDTTTPTDSEQIDATAEANPGVNATDTFVPSATPTRVLRPSGTETPDSTSTEASELPETSVGVPATAVTTDRKATVTPTGEPTRRFLLTPTATSFVLPAATATKSATSGPVLATAVIPFVPTPTPTPTPLSTLVLVPTLTPTSWISPWRSPTPTSTETPFPTPTEPTATSVLPTPTATLTETDDPVWVETETETPFPTPTNTRRPTLTPTATAVPPTSTLLPTSTPAPTGTASPTATLPVPTNTPVPTATPSPMPTNTALPTATPSPMPTNTALPTATPSPTDTPLPTDTPVPTATPTNIPPVLVGETPPTATIDTDYLYFMTVSDSDGSATDLKFDVLEKPAWLQFEFLTPNYLKFSGRPSVNDVGDHKVKVQVHDVAGGMRETEFVITVAPNTALGPFADTTQEVVSATNGSEETTVLGTSNEISKTSP